MAMVMCLSLAAPAFAEAEEAPEAPEASTSEVVEEEAPEGEKEEEKLEAEAVELATAIGYKESGTVDNGAGQAGWTNSDNETKQSKGFTITVNGQKKEYTWDSNGDEYVSVTVSGSDTAVLGGDVFKTYTATLKNGMYQAGLQTTSVVYVKKTARMALDNSNIAWTELTNSNDYYANANVATQVKGFIYAEEFNGAWTAYFKLYPVNAAGNAFNTSAKAEDMIYAERGVAANPNTDVKIQNAIRDVDTNNAWVAKDHTVAVPAVVPTINHNQLPNNLVVYQYDVIDAQGCNTNANTVVALTADTATFKVRVTYVAMENNQQVTKVESDSAKVKTALTEKGEGVYKVDSVSEADANGYFTVNVTRDTNAAAANGVTGVALGENTARYVDPSTQNNYIVLVDVANGGSYKKNQNDTEMSSIVAGTKMGGPVAVLAETIDNDDDLSVSGNLQANGKYYYWDSLADMKNGQTKLVNNNCGKEKSVAYVQLNMFVKNGSTENKGVVLNANANGDFVSAKLDNNNNPIWAETTGADVATGTYDMKKSEDHFYVTEVENVAPTCKKEGSETTKVICKKCGNVRSSETKTVPAITTSVEKNPAGSAQGAAESDIVYKKDAQGNYTNGNPNTTHFISEYETVTVAATKSSAGSITYKFKCNLGEYHDELQKVVELKAEELQHSGKWDQIKWSTQNTAQARTPGALYGYTPFIYDTDAEFGDVLIDTTTAANFFNDYGGLAVQSDGTYYGQLWSNVIVNNPNIQTVSARISKKDENGKIVTDANNSFYQGVVIVKDIKNGEKDCQDGSATIEISIYKTQAANTDIDTPKDLAEAIKNRQATLVGTAFTKEIIVPAWKSHTDANSDGLCDNCGATIEQGTVEPVTGLVDISTATVTFKDMTYTGKVAQPTVTVILDGVKLAKGVDYEVEEMQDVDAGTYPLIVKGTGDFTGRVVGNVTIKQAASSMKTKSAPKTLTANKNKAVTGQIKMTVKGGKVAKYKVTGKVAGVSVNKKGKITVKKGNKKAGTLKVKVTMTPDANHTAAKAVTVKVAIKAAKK